MDRDNKPIKIRLDKCLQTQAWLPDELFQRRAYKRICECLLTILDDADDNKQRRDKICDCRVHNTIFVSGPRGAGKTSFILHIERYFERWRQKKKKKYKAGELFRFFKPLDPTLLENNESFMTSVLAHIVNDCEARLEDKNQSNALDSDIDAYYKRLEAVSDSLRALQKETQYEGLEKIASQQSGIKLEQHLHEFFEIVTRLCKVKALVLLIDDIDMALDRGFEILDVVRRNLASPYIIPVLTGEKVLYDDILDNKFKTDLRTLQRRHDDHTDELFDTKIKRIRDSYLTKVFPPHLRVILLPIPEILNKKFVVLVSKSKNKIDLMLFVEIVRRLLFSVAKRHYHEKLQRAINRFTARTFIEFIQINEKRGGTYISDMADILKELLEAHEDETKLQNLIAAQDEFLVYQRRSNPEDVRELTASIHAQIGCLKDRIKDGTVAFLSSYEILEVIEFIVFRLLYSNTSDGHSRFAEILELSAEYAQATGTVGDEVLDFQRHVERNVACLKGGYFSSLASFKTAIHVQNEVVEKAAKEAKEVRYRPKEDFESLQIEFELDGQSKTPEETFFLALFGCERQGKLFAVAGKFLEFIFSCFEPFTTKKRIMQCMKHPPLTLSARPLLNKAQSKTLPLISMDAIQTQIEHLLPMDFEFVNRVWSGLPEPVKKIPELLRFIGVLHMGIILKQFFSNVAEYNKNRAGKLTFKRYAQDIAHMFLNALALSETDQPILDVHIREFTRDIPDAAYECNVKPLIDGDKLTLTRIIRSHPLIEKILDAEDMPDFDMFPSGSSADRTDRLLADIAEIVEELETNQLDDMQLYREIENFEIKLRSEIGRLADKDKTLIQSICQNKNQKLHQYLQVLYSGNLKDVVERIAEDLSMSIADFQFQSNTQQS